ncbi:MAG TPA: FliH/SctL family protein [Holophaga sp.]|nr:FliH/SctL family protein [Holophaga sp.]
MSLSSPRIIPAHVAEEKDIEGFPYFAATFTVPFPEESSEDDAPVLSELTTPEEDAERLASVDQQIQTKLQRAEEEAQDIARKAYEEGFAAGEAEGRAFGESQYASYIQRLNGHLQELSQSCDLLSHAGEEEILALSLAFGEYLAAQQILGGQQAIRSLIQSVLDAHPFSNAQPSAAPGQADQAAAVIFLNPKDREELGDIFMDHHGLLIREDPELSRGSLRMETPEGVLDATLERRRDRLIEMIHRQREQGLS